MLIASGFRHATGSFLESTAWNSDPGYTLSGGSDTPSYPAAYTALNGQRSCIEVHVDEDIAQLRWVSFGLVQRHSEQVRAVVCTMGGTGTTWGVTISTAEAPVVTDNAEGEVLHLPRQLRKGDILQGLADVTAGWYEVRLNETEFKHRFAILTGTKEDFWFGVCGSSSDRDEHHVQAQPAHTRPSGSCSTVLVEGTGSILCTFVTSVLAGPVRFTVTGSSGQGLTHFAKLFIYEYAGRQAPHLRPDIIYVYRDPFCSHTPVTAEERVHIVMLYWDAAAQQSAVFKANGLIGKIANGVLVNHTVGRAMVVIADSYAPGLVDHELCAGNPDVKLILFVASTMSREAADAIVSYDFKFSADEMYVVPSLGWEEYTRMGFQCADEATRAFLWETAHNGRNGPLDPQRLAPTPKKVLVVMRYMYEVMGGSARWFLRFKSEAFLVGDENAVADFVARALEEATGGPHSDWAEHIRVAVN
jgi:hypothetical protein